MTVILALLLLSAIATSIAGVLKKSRLLKIASFLLFAVFAALFLLLGSAFSRM